LVLDVSLGCAESNQLRLFFSVAEKRSLTLSLANDEYEVWEAAGTMDPLTPNRVTFPGLAGVACRS
jgi:1-aminocyclopropane-1-carboxylate deaminase/D-cysteine desulfhydrase-like pyridoxal-dependent ACC family enzyme